MTVMTSYDAPTLDGRVLALEANATEHSSIKLSDTTACAAVCPDPITPLQSLADALVSVRQQGSLSTAKLAEIASAPMLLAKISGKRPDQLPAAPEHLTPIIQDCFPARYRISPKRWHNAISLIRTLLRNSGLHAPSGGEQALAPGWVALIAALPNNWKRHTMLVFARWCSESEIGPEDVTEQTLEDYKEFRRTRTIRTHLPQLTAGIRILWNRSARANLPGWPTRILVAPRRPHVEALPIACFPRAFRQELASYLAKHTEPDPFDAECRGWRPTTEAAVRRTLVRVASLAATRLGGPQHLTGLKTIISVDLIESAFRHYFERAGKVWREHVVVAATYLLALARYVHADAPTLARIEELRAIISKRVSEQRKPGLSERVSHRLMPFDDPRMLRRLFLLPTELYLLAKKERDADPPRLVRGAHFHEQALMLDLLQHDPMRRFNLASLNFLDDFICDERGRINRLWIPGNKTKNGIAIDTVIPPELAKRLRDHIHSYRPNLRGSHSPWLFPSPKGSARAPDNVTKSLGRVVRVMLGVTFTPHMMRHIVATVLYRRDPHNGVVVQRKLRHRSLKITEQTYGVLSNAGSNAAWQRELDSFRRAKTGGRNIRELQRKPAKGETR